MSLEVGAKTFWIGQNCCYCLVARSKSHESCVSRFGRAAKIGEKGRRVGGNQERRDGRSLLVCNILSLNEKNYLKKYQLTNWIPSLRNTSSCLLAISIWGISFRFVSFRLVSLWAQQDKETRRQAARNCRRVSLANQNWLKRTRTEGEEEEEEVALMNSCSLLVSPLSNFGHFARFKWNVKFTFKVADE